MSVTVSRKRSNRSGPSAGFAKSLVTCAHVHLYYTVVFIIMYICTVRTCDGARVYMRMFSIVLVVLHILRIAALF